MIDRPPIIDAHVHLGPPKYATIEEFERTMTADDVAGAVLVQHLGNSDNRYLACVRTGDLSRFAAVAIVDRLDDVAPVLDAGFVGLRLSPTGLAGPRGAEVFDALDDHRAAVSVTGPTSDVISAEFRSIVRTHPQVRFRIEHVGGFRYGSTSQDLETLGALLRLADESNVTLMWSGFFLNAATAYPFPDTHGFLAETLAAFGSTRIMWSGDWNRAGLGPHDYRQAIEFVGLVAGDDQRADILSGTAQRVFGLAID